MFDATKPATSLNSADDLETIAAVLGLPKGATVDDLNDHQRRRLARSLGLPKDAEWSVIAAAMTTSRPYPPTE